MSPYRNPAEMPKEKGRSFMRKLGDLFEKVMDFVVALFPVAFVIGIICAIGGGLYALSHLDNAERMHREHDAYVLNMEICEVHHAWYVPSEDISTMTACRRLSDHSLFYVQRSGREIAPVVD